MLIVDCVFGNRSVNVSSFEEALDVMQHLWLMAYPDDKIIPNLSYLQGYFCCFDPTADCTCQRMREALPLC